MNYGIVEQVATSLARHAATNPDGKPVSPEHLRHMIDRERDAITTLSSQGLTDDHPLIRAKEARIRVFTSLLETL